jgi:WD40-like Beta Propeller Repeat
MADLREAFEMVKQQTQPDQDSWSEQERRMRRGERKRKIGALASVAALVLVVTIVVVSNLEDPNPSAAPASDGPSVVTAGAEFAVYESGGKIFVSGESGSPVALTRGYSPTLSPDGTTIAFLRDPPDPHYHGHGDPFVLQAWVIHPDGSGLRKLGQQHECCMGFSSDLYWSSDGSSVVLTGGPYEQRIDVATGESLPMASRTG